MADSISLSQVVVLLGIIIHFITFVGIFTKLENRLTKLETLLEYIVNERKKPL